MSNATLRGSSSSSSGVIVPESSSAPGSPVEGQMYINTTDNTLYIYYAGSFQVVVVLVGSGASSYLLFENGDRVLMENGDIFTLQ